MIRVKILTPYKVFLEKECYLVVFPGDEGEMGVQENHIAVVSKLEPGEVRLYDGEKLIDRCFVYGGLANFKENELSIMADDVKIITELDLKYAEENFKFYSEEQKICDQENTDDLLNNVLLYRRMLEVGQRH